jgi:exo-1,4-beta-D-glucosaminidase
MLVNHTLNNEHGLQAMIRVRNLDGGVPYERRLQGIDLAGNGTRQLATLPEIAGLSRVYFIELELTSAVGKSRNVYWLSTQTDELDWAHSNWYLTPVTQYADLTPLQSLPTVTSEVRATLRHEGAEDIATVTLTVPPSSRAVALFQHVSIRRSAGGELMLPILWSDNDVTLWPGESLTLTAHFVTSGAAAPVVPAGDSLADRSVVPAGDSLADRSVVEVSGWNVPTQSVPVAVETRTAASQGRNH